MRDPNTNRRTRANPLRRSAAVACLLTAVGVLAAPALVPSASSAGALDFPYVDHFDTADGGSLDGDAAIVDGRLRLTDSVRNQAGAWSTDDTFPSDVGLEIEFQYSMYNDVGDPGADGLLMFLADGAAPQGVGSFGASLGYACRSSLTQGGELPCDLPGVPGGFAAVALDHFGNFSQPLNLSGPGKTPDSVVVRGSGDGVTGYRYVAGASAPGGLQTAGEARRRVRVTLLPEGQGRLSITVRIESGGALRTVLDRVPLHGDGQAPLPDTLRLGFAAATGYNVDVHEVDTLAVWKPADLAVEHDLPPTAAAGGPVRYAVTARNVGPNASDPSRLEVDVPDALQDVSWTCAAGAGSGCASDSGTGDVTTEVGLPRAGSVTVTVSGRLPAGAGGTLESVATITPAAPLGDVDETDNVSRASATVEPGAGPGAQVETGKSVSPSTGVRPGDEVEYLVTVRNRGPAVAHDVGAVDDLPSAMRFAGSDDGCTAVGQRVTCASGEDLAAGGSRGFRIRAVLDAGYDGDGSDVVNIATATSPTDPDGGDPSPGVPVEVVDDGGHDDDGAGGGPPDEGGPGDGGTDDGSGEPGAGAGGGAGADGGARGGAGGSGSAGGGTHGTRGALAYTGVDGLGALGALAGATVAIGGACWWAVRRRARRQVGAPHPD